MTQTIHAARRLFLHWHAFAWLWWASVTNAEKETVRLRALLQRLGGAALEEKLPPARRAPPDMSSPIFAVSPTAGAVQALRGRGISSLAEHRELQKETKAWKAPNKI